MAQVSVASTIHAEQNTCALNSSKNQGVLKAEGKEHQIFPFSDTASASEGVSDFLQEINQQPVPEGLDHEVIVFTPEMLEIEEQIARMQAELASTQQEEVVQKDGSNPKSDSFLKNASDPKLSGKDPNTKILERRASSTENTHAPTAKSTIVHTSLFALARSFNKSLSEARSEKALLQENQGKQESKENSPHAARINKSDETVHDSYTQTKHEKDQEKEHQQRERNQGNEDQEQEGNPKKKQDVKKINIKAISTNTSTARPSVNLPKKSMGQTSRAEPARGGEAATPVLGSVENLFYRFMALMARILGQAEAEAHALYLRIKDRTDSIDQLTLLLSKINAEKGTIDWTKNDEMKQLIDKARAIGVEIPEGKYKWTEDEKKLLKENIQMRKDSMEKVTQLERTDMQRFLQEASQCHQARSNILKLLKEVVDTIIHNFRGN